MASVGLLYGTENRFVEILSYYTGCAHLGDGFFLVAGYMSYVISNENGEQVEAHPWTARAAVVHTTGCSVDFITRPVALGVAGVPVSYGLDFTDEPTYGCARLGDNRAVIAGCADGGRFEAPATVPPGYAHTGLAWVAELDRASMELTIGNPAIFDVAVSVSDSPGREWGLMGDILDSSLGVCALDDTTVVVGYGFVEDNLVAGTDVGGGDLSGSDPLGYQDDQSEWYYTKICPLTVSGLTITPGTPVRVHPRSSQDDFMSTDQILRLSANKGVFVYPAENFRGYAVVFTMADGEIEHHERTMFSDDPPEMEGRNIAGASESGLTTAEKNDPKTGTFGFLMGRAVALNQRVVCTLGANGYSPLTPFRTFLVDGYGFEEQDYIYPLRYEVWPFLAHVGGGRVFAATTNDAAQKRPDGISDSVSEEYNQFAMTGVLVEVDLETGLILGFDSLGVLSNGWWGSETIGNQLVETAYSGRHIVWDDATDIANGDNSQIFVINYHTMGVIDPICWEFPQTDFENNPSPAGGFKLDDFLWFDIDRGRGSPGASPGIQRVRVMGERVGGGEVD